MPGPDAIDDDPRREWIVRAPDALGQFTPTARLAITEFTPSEHGEKLSRNFLTKFFMVATQMNASLFGIPLCHRVGHRQCQFIGFGRMCSDLYHQLRAGHTHLTKFAVGASHACIRKVL